jgi:parvulin-like peptidyl-prolyl isomerase
MMAFAAAVLAFATALAGCGSNGSGGQVIARVGDEPITRSALEHWTRVLAGGTAVANDPAANRGHALRERALEFLISSKWLIGEADRRGVVISGREVRQQIDRLEKVDFPGGVEELREFLKSTGQTMADVELQARAELASVKLRELAVANAKEASAAEIATYYARHKHRYLVPERRLALFDNTKKRDKAERIKRKVEAGQSLTPEVRRSVGEIYAGAKVPPGDPYEAAIDSAKPGVVTGPFSIGADFWLYKVVKVIPAHQRTLAQVARSIRHQITAEHRRAALRSFIRFWTARWATETDCAHGYVVRGCKQYSQVQSPADELPSD